MNSNRVFKTTVKPRRDLEDDPRNSDFSDDQLSEDGSTSDNVEDEAPADAIEESDDGSAVSKEEAGDINDGRGGDFSDISFGALAKAQATLAPTRGKKRKLAEVREETEDDLDAPERFGTRDKNEAASLSRSSKHAPAIQSSRRPVSRKREIFEASATLKSRDPRFDPTIAAAGQNRSTSAAEKANRDYSFLNTYQAAEVLDLKAQLKKSISDKNSNPAEQAALKREIMSMEAKLRNSARKQRETEILREHRQKEKDSIRSGQKSNPYFLKKADLKKQIDQERLDKMSKKAKDKSEKRKLKREKGKEARDMPMARRSMPS